MATQILGIDGKPANPQAKLLTQQEKMTNLLRIAENRLRHAPEAGLCQAILDIVANGFLLAMDPELPTSKVRVETTTCYMIDHDQNLQFKNFGTVFFGKDFLPALEKLKADAEGLTSGENKVQ